MKTEDLKLEAIKKAYREYFEKARPNENGWCQYKNIGHKILQELNMEAFSSFDSDTLRPKSLSGIENNRGWVRIEEDGSNLPKEHEFYNACLYDEKYKDVPMFYAQNLPELNILWLDGIISHYQPIIKPEPPHY